MFLEQVVHEKEPGKGFFLVHEMESSDLGFVSGALGFFAGDIEPVAGTQIRVLVGFFSIQVFRIENFRQIRKGVVGFVAG